MRIVLINRYFHPDQSATSRIVSSLAFALARDGVEVVALASASLHGGPRASLPARQTIDGVEIHRLATTVFGRGTIPGRAMDYLTFHFAAARWILANVERDDICVVCTDPPMLATTAAMPIRWRGGKVVNWIMDLFPEAATAVGVLPDGRVTRLALALRDVGLSRADLTICPMQAMTDHLAGRVGRAGRMATVHHWTDDLEIRPVAVESNPLRQEWDLTGKFVVGYSGNFGRAHEFATVLAAAEILRGEEDVCFLMVGAGQQRAWLEMEARRRRLTNVQFRPFQPPERLAESLGAANVHLISLLPSLEHCIVPSKLYGILAAGRPAIFVGDPAGEVATVLSEGKCGAAVRPGDGTGLAGKIVELRNNPDACREQGRNARAFLEERFSLGAGVARWRSAVGKVGGRQTDATVLDEGCLT